MTTARQPGRRRLPRTAMPPAPPTDRPYGERECTVEDLAGHRWNVTETTADVAPEDYGCTTVEPWPERG